jgi:hypothetical protein
MFSLDKMKPAFGGMFSIVSTLLTFVIQAYAAHGWMIG